MRSSWYWRLGLVAAAVLLAVGLNAGQAPATDVAVDPDDIGGVVEGPSGPEAGVWVLAETDGLPTTFRKIVVTDDLGRFVLPDLPRATYRVWVRGYGLVDSTPVESTPGRIIRLTAVPGAHPAGGRPRSILRVTGTPCWRCPRKQISRAQGAMGTVFQGTSSRRRRGSLPCSWAVSTVIRWEIR